MRLLIITLLAIILCCPDVCAQEKKGFFKRVGDWFAKFNEIDTTYIEPQHYNFATMIQNTNVYRITTIKTKNDYSITLSPDVMVKVGPYFGWRWVFLGYTVDIKNLFKSTEGTYLDLSLYSNLFNIDLYYIDHGRGFKIRRNHIHPTHDTSGLNGKTFDGLSIKAKGFNLFYIINHHHFSYPAAFSQSTVQRRSCGSPLVGIGYSYHTMDIDINKLIPMYVAYVPEAHGIDDMALVNELTSARNIAYSSYNLNGGYAYNWVFARNWLLSVSATTGLAYKITDGELKERHNRVFKDFEFDNINIDFNGRFGIVWNNTRWFAGMNVVAHNYNYRSDVFSSYNTYGTFNFYAGFNFW